MYDNRPMSAVRRRSAGVRVEWQHDRCVRRRFDIRRSHQSGTSCKYRFVSHEPLSPAITYPHVSRDPIHHFIGFSTEERKVIDSWPVQRLRQIHQLAMTALVYPGATNSRFEHSLGVMHMASQIYDVVTDPENLTDRIRQLIPEVHDHQKLTHWRAILRMAALCHDIGHPPYSHAADRLLPKGWTHERLSYELIMGDEMKRVWDGLDPYLRPDLIAKLAIGANEMSKFAKIQFSTWEALLSELIVGDFFGADRMDYLLRDSYHAGVAYGQFDHFRLIATIRILPPPPERGGKAKPAAESADEQSSEPALGVEVGGLEVAQSMLLARMFMFSQVYYHPTRLIYDKHLLDFLKEWFGGEYPTDLTTHLSLTDNEVMVALLSANRDDQAPGHQAAEAILERRHFRVFFELTPKFDEYLEPTQQVYEAACDRFGIEQVRKAEQKVSLADLDYPVLMRDNQVASATSLSVVQQLKPKTYEYVFIKPELRKEAQEWLKKNYASVITKKKDEPE